MILHMKFLKGLDKDTGKEMTRMWWRWDTPQNFLLAFTDEVWKTRKIRILKKWKKNHAGDIIILHMCTKNDNHPSYSSCDTEWDKFALLFWVIFCPLPSSLHHPNDPENQNFEKIKKIFGDVIILNLCNKKHDKIMYAYSDMECNRQFFPI